MEIFVREIMFRKRKHPTFFWMGEDECQVRELASIHRILARHMEEDVKEEACLFISKLLEILEAYAYPFSPNFLSIATRFYFHPGILSVYLYHAGTWERVRDFFPEEIITKTSARIISEINHFYGPVDIGNAA